MTVLGIVDRDRVRNWTSSMVLSVLGEEVTRCGCLQLRHRRSSLLALIPKFKGIANSALCQVMSRHRC